MKNDKNEKLTPKRPTFYRSERYSGGNMASAGVVENLKGGIFVTPAGVVTDLEHVHIVGAFVDTVRQIYNGTLDEGFIHYLESSFESGELIHIKTPFSFDVLTTSWHVQKMGKASGYRYKLQNSEAGFVILVGSFYCKPEIAGSHLKIEVSPHVLLRHAPLDVQNILDFIASRILHAPESQGVALHLACDVQGWQPAHDHLDNFVTYARFVRNYLGLQTAEIGDGFSDVACKYGTADAETITIGRPTGLQTCIYNKTKQARVVDKVDYYNDEWSAYSLGDYDPAGPDVYRIEYRFHHSVIREMSLDDVTSFKTYLEASKILKNLWSYAISKNRLEIAPKTIHPVWQMIDEDVEFQTFVPGFIPARKKKTDLSAVAKNYDLFLGNFISLVARQTDSVKFLISQLKKLHFYDDWLRYQRVIRKRGDRDLRDHLQKQLKLRRMLRNAA